MSSKKNIKDNGERETLVTHERTSLSLFGFLLLALVIFGLILSVWFIIDSVRDYIVNKAQVEYYKAQMLAFCEIAQQYNQDVYPSMYPCERWLV